MAKEIGGYDVIFVEDLNKDYECIVCHLALREPVQLSCGHRFCNSCFEQMKLYSVNRHDLHCPLDARKVDINKVFRDIGIERTILNLLIKCKNYEKGCEWIQELNNLENHLKNDCQKELIKCSIENCDKYEERDKIQQHEGACPKILQNMIKSVQNMEKTVQQLNDRITGYELLFQEKDERLEFYENIVSENSKRLADLEKQVASVRRLEEKVRIIEEIKKKEEMPDAKRPEIRIKFMWLNCAKRVDEYPPEQQEYRALERKIMSILNKLTSQKSRTLLGQMLELEIDDTEKLECLTDLIFEKTINEPEFAVCYVNMCSTLTGSLKGIKDSKSYGRLFRMKLLRKCQAVFENEIEGLLKDEIPNNTLKVEDIKSDVSQQKLTQKKRMLGLMRFLGELFKLKMISSTVIHNCIAGLVHTNSADVNESYLEYLCELMTIIGEDLDLDENAKPRMDNYFDELKIIITQKKIHSRVKFLVENLLLLRQNRWVKKIEYEVSEPVQVWRGSNTM